MLFLLPSSKGDEVLEWNGHQLQNTTFDQVYEIINSSRNDAQVELIVCRNAKLVFICTSIMMIFMCIRALIWKDGKLKFSLLL